MYSQSRDLLLAAAAGDEAAFGKLYDLLAPRVYAIIREVVPDRAQADQVMIEALVEVWRAAPSFDVSQGSAPGWVCSTAHHYAVRRARALRTSATQ